MSNSTYSSVFESLVLQVEVMVRESGKPAGFSASVWLSHWLEEPLPALDGKKPRDILGTIEGQRLVADLLARMQSGAFS